MTGKVHYKPEGYNTLQPYLIVSDAGGLIDFLKQAFDAEDRSRMQAPDGRIIHAEVSIGDSVVMISQHDPGEPAFTAMLHMYLPDPDEAYRRALQAGATSLREPADEFYGDRMGGVQDRFGNQWWLAAHIEDVSAEELQRRIQEQR
jgi:PhnB protein